MPRIGEQTLARLEWAAAWLLGLCVLGLHVLLLASAGALWRDEVNTLNLAALPSLAEMLRHSEFESFPLLFPLLLRGWTALPALAGDAALRALGLGLGVGLLGALCLGARRLGGGPPLLGLALFACNPEVIRWGDSLRAFGLGSALVLLAAPAFFGLATEQLTLRRVGWTTLVALLCAQCLYQDAVLLAALGAGGAAVALRRGGARRALVVLGAGLPAALSLLLYLDTFARAREWNMLIQSSLTLDLLWSKLAEAVGPGGSITLWLWIGSCLLLLGVASLGQRGAQRGRDLLLFCAVTLSSAVGGSLLFVWVVGYQTQPWYYVAPMGVAVLCMDAIASTSAWPWLRRARLLLALALALSTLPAAWPALRERQTNIDLIATSLSRAAGSGDLIVVSPWVYGVSFGRYYHGPAEWITLPPIGQPTLHRYDLIKQQMLRPDPIAPVLARVEQTLRAHRRVLVVGGLPDLDRPEAPRLPAPPLPGSGWNESVYDWAWGLALRELITRHAVSSETWSFGERVSQYERALLERVEGFR